MAEETPRAASAKIKRLARILSFALDRETISAHPLLRFKSRHAADRSDALWTDRRIEAFMTVAGAHLTTAPMLALHTGQCRGDLLAMTWDMYDGGAISLVQSKTKRPVYVPCTSDLSRLPETIPRESSHALLSTEGRPWTTTGFSSAWDRAFERSGIKEDLHSHDLCGTAVTRLAEAGCTVPEIATITGHSLATVGKILEKYLALSQTLANSAIEKLEAAYARRKRSEKSKP